MPHTIRRIVTGHDAAGKAVVISDGPSPFIHVNPRDANNVSTDFWRTHQSPARVAAVPEEPTLGPRRQMPTQNGTVLRINQVPPESDYIHTMTADDSRKAFAALGNEKASTFGKGGRHPLMHRTETIDYAIVLAGEITLVLDNEDVVCKTGDVIVQCGTNHAWSNRSKDPCTSAFVLIDGCCDADLAAKFEA